MTRAQTAHVGARSTLGSDEQTLEIRARSSITGNHIAIAPVLPDLLSQIPFRRGDRQRDADALRHA